MDITHTQKNIQNSPRKMRLVADMIRRQKPIQALTTLKFVNRAAAKDLIKAIQAALANAKQRGQETETMVFKKLEVNEGFKMKRFRAAPRGRVRRYVKRTSQVKIVLSDQGGSNGHQG